MSGWVAGAVVVGAGIGAVASSRSASQQSSAITSSANTQAAANLAAAEMELEFLRENREDIAEAVDAGIIDLNEGYNLAIAELEPLTGLEELNTARNLLEDPNSIMGRPSVQFQYDEGIEALQAAYSRTSGGGLSGPAVKAAQTYGQNLASTALDAELNRLFPFINIGVGARESIANYEAGRGIGLANLKVGGATGSAGITGAAVPGIAGRIATGGQIAGNATIQQANVNTNLMSNYANIATQGVNFAASNPGLFSFSSPAAQPSPLITANNPLGLTPGQGL